MNLGPNDHSCLCFGTPVFIVQGHREAKFGVAKLKKKTILSVLTAAHEHKRDISITKSVKS